MPPTIPQDLIATLADSLRDALPPVHLHNRRQPVHTVYGGAHLFSAETAKKLARFSYDSFKKYAPDFITLSKVMGMPGHESLPQSDSDEGRHLLALAADDLRTSNSSAYLAKSVYERIEEKLQNEAVEDFRIDFEDGYGHRPDSEEDGHARDAAEALAQAVDNQALPPFTGIRIKAFSEELFERSTRTLDIFLTTFMQAGDRLPKHFVVTLPKVKVKEQVEILATLLEELESRLDLPEGKLKMEILVETTPALIGPKGKITLTQFAKAARGRLVSAHLGPYDYTANCGIIGPKQSLQHPACDFARTLMQVAFADTGINVVDGPTNLLPVEVHRGTDLSQAQQDENRKTVHAAWRLSYQNVSRALSNGFYQGWDLHPAQLVSRYAAVYTFFLEDLQATSTRLSRFVETAAKASLTGAVFDDEATGQGLLNHFIRALNCGAIKEEEIASTGLSADEIRQRSFLYIVRERRKNHVP